jgi:hypothetical protein
MDKYKKKLEASRKWKAKNKYYLSLYNKKYYKTKAKMRAEVKEQTLNSQIYP